MAWQTLFPLLHYYTTTLLCFHGRPSLAAALLMGVALPTAAAAAAAAQGKAVPAAGVQPAAAEAARTVRRSGGNASRTSCRWAHLGDLW